MDTPHKNIHLLVNPVSGWGKGVEVAEQLRRRFQARGVACHEMRTRRRGHATELVRRAVEDGAEAMVVCGGDGTVHEAVQSLAHREVCMIPAPAGRCNDFGLALGLDHDLDAVVDAVLAGKTRRWDLVKVNGRYFCTVGAVGFDAVVSRYVDEMKTPLRGKPAYIYGLLRVLTHYQAPRVNLTWDHGEYQGPMFMAAVGNTATYGGAIPVVPMARADDGMLDICLVAGPVGFMRVVGLLPKIMRGKHGEAREVEFLRSTKVTIESHSPVELWAEGEPVASTPLRIEVAPASLWVADPGNGSK